MSFVERYCGVCGVKGHGSDECEFRTIAAKSEPKQFVLELPTYKNGGIVGAHWYTCKIHSQGLPIDQSAGRTICCASADRHDRSLVEANTEIGGCTVTWDADETQVAKALLVGDSVGLMRKIGHREFCELKERVMHKLNQAVTPNLPQRTMEEIQSAFRKARREAHHTYLESEE
jgi:hypothetical protein